MKNLIILVLIVISFLGIRIAKADTLPVYLSNNNQYLNYTQQGYNGCVFINDVFFHQTSHLTSTGYLIIFPGTTDYTLQGGGTYTTSFVNGDKVTITLITGGIGVQHGCSGTLAGDEANPYFYQKYDFWNDNRVAWSTMPPPSTNVTSSSASSNFQQIIHGASNLMAAIVDASYVPVANPSIVMSPVTQGLSCQTSTGNFGTATQQIYVKNIEAADSGWTLTLAGTATSSAWTSSSANANYSFNNPDGSGCTHGQMTVNPSVGTLSIGQCQSGCSINHLSLGNPVAFSRGLTDSITLLSATADADHIGDWALKNVSISQNIPAGQAVADDYNINMVLTVTAY